MTKLPSISDVSSGSPQASRKTASNLQIGTENQFILGYSLHQRPADARCLIPHLDHVKEMLGKLPDTLIADAGYGGEENYAYLEREKVNPLAKYAAFHQEQSQAWRRDVSRLESWTYDAAQDEWVCPNGQHLAFTYESESKTASGYSIRLRHYRSPDCSGYPFREQCEGGR